MKPRTKIALVATAFLIAYMLVLWMLIPSSDRDRRPLPQLTPTEKSAFKARLFYHGLRHEVSIIYDYPESPYFIRGGKKCKF